MWRLGILLAVASCGRLGFTDLPAEVNPDASGPSTDAAPKPLVLTCGAPQRFAFDSDEQGIGVAARASGFDVFDVDSDATVWGYSFALGSGGSLTAVATKTQLAGMANGTLGGAAIGDDVVLALANTGSATITTTLALDPSLDISSSPPSDTTAAAGEMPLASNGASLMLAQTTAGSDAIVRLVNIDGDEAPASTLVGSAGIGPYYENAMATNAGFALGYGTELPSQRAQLAVLDAALNITTGPVTIDGGQDMYSPWFAYSPALDEFLVAWHQKDQSDLDDTWAMIVDSTLNTVVQPFEVAATSTNVVAGADADGFWLAYDTYMPANIMAASHVDANGNVTARPVISSGGSPQQWIVVERDGQAILVWTETGGSGPNLYLDPFCN